VQVYRYQERGRLQEVQLRRLPSARVSELISVN
jgi:hypothetical protein